MKTLKKVLFFIAGIGFLIACSKSDRFWGDEPLGNTIKDGNGQPVMVTTPFKADFIGNYMPTTGVDEEMCGVFPMIRVFNEGGGTATHLGRFTHYFDFCANWITGEYPAGHMVAYFVAANGDILHVSCAGYVVEGRLDYHPDDVNSYFKDPFVILGGTGRFEGATGSGYTDDYNRDSYPDNSFHHWTGTITLAKGKQ